MFGSFGVPFVNLLLGARVDTTANPYASTCKAISKAISSASAVYYPGSPQYASDIYHAVPSSTLNSACSVEPGNAADVSTILKVLAKTTTPFGIKSRGHSFDSTSTTYGVLIALVRLNSIQYSSKTQVATVGVSAAWQDVYSYLEPYNRTVIGGRIKDVGVGGFLLGGGYSYLSSRRGLGMDNVVAYELVLPGGEITTVTSANKELFFALKGGFNNFGVVTKVVLNTFFQGPVYAGVLLYTGDQIPVAHAAVSKISLENKDLDVSIVAQINGTVFVVFAFYNAPVAPPGLFDGLTTIPNTANTIGTKGFVPWVYEASTGSENAPQYRGLVSTAKIQDYTLEQVQNLQLLSTYYSAGGGGAFAPDAWAVFTIEPFVAGPDLSRPYKSTAFPHEVYNSPLTIYWGWHGAQYDDAARKTIVEATNNVTSFSKAHGVNTSPLLFYANYALATEPLENIYGDNLPRLKLLRKKYDPKGLMLRTSGFKFV